MLFERIGTIALKRGVFWSLFSLSILLVPLTASFLFPLFKKQNEFQEEMEMARKRSCQTFLARKANIDFQKTYQNSDALFLKKLEDLTFLEKEKAALFELSKNPAFKEDLKLKERQKFLEENHLSFLEVNVRSQDAIEESEQKLKHAVEVSSSDLNRLFTALDDPHAPQIIITDLYLKKIPNHRYELNIQLLQRVFNYE